MLYVAAYFAVGPFGRIGVPEDFTTAFAAQSDRTVPLT
jgi:hypothetical protein